MEQIFLNTIREAADKVKNKLIEDTYSDYIRDGKGKELTPSETIELANKAINLHLAQELHYRLTFKH